MSVLCARALGALQTEFRRCMSPIGRLLGVSSRNRFTLPPRRTNDQNNKDAARTGRSEKQCRESRDIMRAGGKRGGTEATRPLLSDPVKDGYTGGCKTMRYEKIADEGDGLARQGTKDHSLLSLLLLPLVAAKAHILSQGNGFQRYGGVFPKETVYRSYSVCFIFIFFPPGLFCTTRT